MYLVIKDDNGNRKSYNVTSACNTPYLGVSNSFLPLTLNTSQGLQLRIKDQDNVTTAVSQTTIQTSSTDNIGMSSTSGITRSASYDTAYITQTEQKTQIVTTGTSHLTRSSTSGSGYLTAKSTTDTSYLTRKSTYDTLYLTTSSVSGTSYLTGSSTSGSEWLTSSYTATYRKSTKTYASAYNAWWTATTGTTYLTSRQTTGSNVYTYQQTGAVYAISTYVTATSSNETITLDDYDVTVTYTYNSWITEVTPPLGPRTGTSSYRTTTTSYTVIRVYDQVTSTITTNTYYSSTTYTNTQYYTSPVTYSAVYGTVQTSGTTTREAITYGAFTFTGTYTSSYDRIYYTCNTTTGTSALTRKSTYNEIYSTRESIYNTVYYTEMITTGTTYYTRASTSDTSYFTNIGSQTVTNSVGTSTLTSESIYAYSGVVNTESTVSTFLTWRPAEYRQITADVSTYYTSSTNQGNMSNITNLTRESTSGSVFFTTSTITSTKALTISGWQSSRFSLLSASEQLGFYNRAYITNTTYITGTMILNNLNRGSYNKTSARWTYDSITVTGSSTRNYTTSVSRQGSYTLTSSTTTTFTRTDIIASSVWNNSTSTGNTYSTSLYGYSLGSSSWRSYTFSFEGKATTQTTGTSSWTGQTITSTSYLTKESISGYSGISSGYVNTYSFYSSSNYSSGMSETSSLTQSSAYETNYLTASNSVSFTSIQEVKNTTTSYCNGMATYSSTTDPNTTWYYILQEVRRDNNVPYKSITRVSGHNQIITGVKHVVLTDFYGNERESFYYSLSSSLVSKETSSNRNLVSATSFSCTVNYVNATSVHINSLSSASNVTDTVTNYASSEVVTWNNVGFVLSNATAMTTNNYAYTRFDENGKGYSEDRYSTLYEYLFLSTTTLLNNKSYLIYSGMSAFKYALYYNNQPMTNGITAHSQTIYIPITSISYLTRESTYYSGICSSTQSRESTTTSWV